MPNIKSAKKRVLTSQKNATRNKVVKKAYKEAVKAFEADTKNEELLNKAIGAVDKAWSKGVLKKNTAARKKSNLAKKLNK